MPPDVGLAKPDAEGEARAADDGGENEIPLPGAPADTDEAGSGGAGCEHFGDEHAGQAGVVHDGEHESSENDAGGAEHCDRTELGLEEAEERLLGRAEVCEGTAEGEDDHCGGEGGPQQASLGAEEELGRAGEDALGCGEAGLEHDPEQMGGTGRPEADTTGAEQSALDEQGVAAGVEVRGEPAHKPDDAARTRPGWRYR